MVDIDYIMVEYRLLQLLKVDYDFILLNLVDNGWLWLTILNIMDHGLLLFIFTNFDWLWLNLFDNGSLLLTIIECTWLLLTILEFG